MFITKPKISFSKTLKRHFIIKWTDNYLKRHRSKENNLIRNLHHLFAYCKIKLRLKLIPLRLFNKKSLDDWKKFNNFAPSFN